MKQFFSLFKKEFSAFFASHLIYFLVGIYLLLSMVCTFYLGGYFSAEDVSLAGFFALQFYLLIIIVPAVTMRSWAEEKKLGTYEITLTYPISASSAVWAKFLASFSVLCLMVLATVPFWVYSNSMMVLDNCLVLSSYVGILLFAMILCAVGCFVSSLTSSVVFSYLLSVLISWGLIVVNFNFILKPIAFAVPDLYVILQGSLNLGRHLTAFTEGLISFDDLVFLISLALVFVFSNKFVLENRRDKQRHLNAIYFLCLFLVFVFINIFSTIFFAEHMQDFTADKRYKFSSATKEIVQELPQKVEVKLYVSEDISVSDPEYAEYVNYVINRLFEYENISDNKIEVDIRAVQKNSLAEKEAKENKIMSFISPNGEQLIYFGAVFSDYSGKYFTIPNFISARKNLLENDVSRLLYKFSHFPPKKIAWIDAAGTDDFSDVRDVLENDYQIVDVQQIIFQITSDYDAVVVPNFQDSSILLTYGLDQYLLRGGKLLLFADNLNEYQKTMKDLSLYPLEFFKNINLLFDEEKVVVDEALASEISIEDIRGNKRLISDVLNINLRTENINQENIITKGLDKLNFISPAMITEIERNSKVTTQSLLKTSPEAGSVNVGVARAAVSEYVGSFYDKEERLFDLAYLIEGTASSIFEKNIFGIAGYDRDDLLQFVQYSISPFKVIAVADTGVLKLDGYGLQGDVFNPYLITEPNDNLRFVTRSVDYLTGNEQLLSINDKLTLRNYESLYSKISKEVKSENGKEVESIRKEIYDNEFKIKQISAEREELSAARVKDVEGLNQANISLREKLKMFENRTISQIDTEVALIVVSWMIIYPLLFIFVLFLLVKVYYIRKIRKMKELFDENKNI